MVLDGLDCPLGQLGSAVPPVSPQPLAHPQLLHWWGEEQERPRPCVILAQQLKHAWVIRAVSNTNPNHSPHRLLGRKLTLLQPKAAQLVRKLYGILPLSTPAAAISQL